MFYSCPLYASFGRILKRLVFAVDVSKSKQMKHDLKACLVYVDLWSCEGQFDVVGEQKRDLVI